MPEYSSTTITPADGVQVPSMNGSTSGNFLLSALKSYILAEKGQANGLASLGSDGKLTAAQLPDLADDVIVVASYAVLPAAGTAGKIYITADNNKLYRWDPDLETPDYVELSVDLSAYATKAELAAEESARETEDSRLKSAIQGNSQRIENLEVAVSGSLVQTNVLTDPPSMANVRTITNANEILPWAILKRVGARAIAWNQMVPELNSTNWQNLNNTTSSFSGNKVTFTTLQSYGGVRTNLKIDALAGHKYFFSFLANKNNTAIVVATNNGNLSCWPGSATQVTQEGSMYRWRKVVSVDTTETNSSIYIWDTRGSAWDEIQVADLIICDLTAMNEASLTADQFRAKFPASYYPYNTGEIIPLNPSGFKVVGKQKWDEVTEDGYIGSDGSLIGGSEHKRSKNFSPCQPSTSYYITIPSSWTSATPTLCWYDIDKNFIMRSDFLQFPVYTAPPNAYYFKITLFNYGTTYRYDVMVCLNSVTDKTYEAYSETTIDTPQIADGHYVNENCYDYVENVVEDGIVKGKFHDVADVVVYDGSSDEVWGEYSTGTNRFTIKCSNIKQVASSVVPNILCDKLDTYCKSGLGSERAITSELDYFIVRIGSSITTVSELRTWLASNPITVNYELATESVTYVDPIPNIPCEDGTTVTAVTPQTDLVNAIDVPSTIAYMTKISS